MDEFLDLESLMPSLALIYYASAKDGNERQVSVCRENGRAYVSSSVCVGKNHECKKAAFCSPYRTIGQFHTHPNDLLLPSLSDLLYWYWRKHYFKNGSSIQFNGIAGYEGAVVYVVPDSDKMAEIFETGHSSQNRYSVIIPDAQQEQIQGDTIAAYIASQVNDTVSLQGTTTDDAAKVLDKCKKINSHSQYIRSLMSANWSPSQFSFISPCDYSAFMEKARASSGIDALE